MNETVMPLAEHMQIVVSDRHTFGTQLLLCLFSYNNPHFLVLLPVFAAGIGRWIWVQVVELFRCFGCEMPGKVRWRAWIFRTGRYGRCSNPLRWIIWKSG